jgi:surface antigen
MRYKFLALAILATFALSVTLADAAPPPWAGGGGGPPGKAKKFKKQKKFKNPKSRGGAARLTRGPPPWAPAHGYRRKFGSGYAIPYGIGRGKCDRQALGSAVGSAIGSRVGKGDRSTSALIGSIAGALISGYLGRSGDKVDTACMGQVMEHAVSGKHVSWRNPDTRTRYNLTPTRSYRHRDGRYCREYIAGAVRGGRGRTDKGLACRRSNGVWDIIR